VVGAEDDQKLHKTFNTKTGPLGKGKCHLTPTNGGVWPLFQTERDIFGRFVTYGGGFVQGPGR